MKRLWPLAALVAMFPTLMGALVIMGDTQRLLEFFPLLFVGTVGGIFALVLLYREGRDTTK